MTVTVARSASRRCLACAAAALGLLLSGRVSGGIQVAAADAPRHKTHTVVIEGTSFNPARFTIAAGDTVVWVNKDPFPHTATSTAGAFDSGSIAPDKSWRFRLLKPGEFSYICSLHPTMKGLVKVE